jgi:hypothetical protein
MVAATTIIAIGDARSLQRSAGGIAGGFFHVCRKR